MGKHYQQARQGHGQNASPVWGSQVAGVSGILSHGFANLHGKGSGNGAGKVAGANLFTLLEAQDSKVLFGVAAVSESRRSWSSPSRHLAKVTGEVQGKAGVDLLDRPKANLMASQWVEDVNLVGLDLEGWNDVVGVNNAQNQHNNRNASDASFEAGVEALQAGNASEEQTCKCNDVARGGSFHPEIVARKEQFNGNL